MPETAPLPRHAVSAIDFGGTKIDLAVADHEGTLLKGERLLIDHEASAEEIVRTAVEGQRALMRWAAEARGLRSVAAAVASPGIVAEDHIALAPNVHGWEQLSLPAMLRAGLEIDAIQIGNDVNFATLAELHLGALRGVENGAYIGLGTGIGAGLVIGGRVVRGGHGAAGEVGYLRYGSSRTAEDRAGGRAITRVIATTTSVDASTVIREGDSGIVEDVLDAIAGIIEVLTFTTDPSVVVLGGGLMEAADVILPGVQLRLDRLPLKPDLRPGAFVHDAVIRGLCLAAAKLADGIAPEWT